MNPFPLQHLWKKTSWQVHQKGFDTASTLPTDSSSKNAKRLLKDKFHQKRISSFTELAVSISWSCLLDGQRRAQLSVQRK
ncbi:hypothetical protein TNCV_1524261 [Trichonephila clavipes]|nr:hypothetical protein TNCV_1524261 [Trichonephila clavipes]